MSRDVVNTFFIITILSLCPLVLILPGVYPNIKTYFSFMNYRYFNIIYIWAAAAFIFSVAAMYRVQRKHLINLLICAFSLFIVISSLSNLPQNKLTIRELAAHAVLEAKSSGLPLQNGLAVRDAARPTQIILNDGNRVIAIARGTFNWFYWCSWLRPYPGNAKTYNYVLAFKNDKEGVAVELTPPDIQFLNPKITLLLYTTTIITIWTTPLERNTKP